ncbi:MAG: DUF2304 domain-containing protein [Dermabacter sp.]|nr:DUF2304 domain-containing protein [Dermabacter sp.]
MHISSVVFFGILAISTLVLVILMLRSRKLREKYAVLWLLVAVAVLVLALVPNLLEYAARFLGVSVPSNLLFAAAIFFLLCICLQLSLEVCKRDDETRVLSEEVALLRLDLDQLRAGTSAPPSYDPSAAPQMGEQNAADTRR